MEELLFSRSAPSHVHRLRRYRLRSVSECIAEWRVRGHLIKSITFNHRRSLEKYRSAREANLAMIRFSPDSAASTKFNYRKAGNGRSIGSNTEEGEERRAVKILYVGDGRAWKSSCI